MALDIGEKRIGVAISDPSQRVATALTVLDAKRVLGDGGELPGLVEEYEVGRIIVGLPLSLDGTEGPQASQVRTAAERVAGFLPVPMDFIDERLSSVEASRAMFEAGSSTKRQRGAVDMVAAALFLQSYLDARKSAIE